MRCAAWRPGDQCWPGGHAPAPHWRRPRSIGVGQYQHDDLARLRRILTRRLRLGAG